MQMLKKIKKERSNSPAISRTAPSASAPCATTSAPSSGGPTSTAPSGGSTSKPPATTSSPNKREKKKIDYFGNSSSESDIGSLSSCTMSYNPFFSPGARKKHSDSDDFST